MTWFSPSSMVAVSIVVAVGIVSCDQGGKVEHVKGTQTSNGAAKLSANAKPGSGSHTEAPGCGHETASGHALVDEDQGASLHGDEKEEAPEKDAAHKDCNKPAVTSAAAASGSNLKPAVAHGH